MVSGTLLARFLALTDDVTSANEALDRLKHERAIVEERLRNEFERTGIANLKSLDGRVVYLHRSLYARARGGDRLAVTKALSEIGADDLITQTFNVHSLSAYVRELDRDGKEIPEALADVIEVTEMFSLSVRAG